MFVDAAGLGRAPSALVVKVRPPRKTGLTHLVCEECLACSSSSRLSAACSMRKC